MLVPQSIPRSTVYLSIFLHQSHADIFTRLLRLLHYRDRFCSVFAPGMTNLKKVAAPAVAVAESNAAVAQAKLHAGISKGLRLRLLEL